MTAVLDDRIAAFLDGQRVGVFATASPEGRPRQSLVYYARDGERLLVTTEATRGKVRDVARTGWASLAVHGDAPPFPSATVAGPAHVINEEIGELTALVAQRIMSLDEPPEPQPEADLRAAGRVIVSMEIERVGPVSYID